MKLSVKINRITATGEPTTWFVLVNGKKRKIAKTKATCTKWIERNYKINELTGNWEKI